MSSQGKNTLLAEGEPVVEVSVVGEHVYAFVEANELLVLEYPGIYEYGPKYPAL